MPQETAKIDLVIRRTRCWWLINQTEINDPRAHNVTNNHYFCFPVEAPSDGNPGKWAFVCRDGRIHDYLAHPPETRLTPEQEEKVKEMIRTRTTGYDGIPPYPVGSSDNADYEAKWYLVYCDEDGRFLQMA